MKESRPRVVRVVATAFFLFAIAFLGLSAPLYWNQWKVLKTWPKASATVIRSGIIALNPVQGETLYDEEYVLSFPAGRNPCTVVIRSHRPSTDYQRTARQVAQLPTGAVRVISYNPANPADIRIRPGYNIHFFMVPVVVTAIGLAFAVVGLILLLISMRHGKEHEEAESYPEIRRRVA
jgi:hypothetical protein